PYYLGRNEQSMVHSSVAYAKMKNRRQCMACLSSIGPGATNMVTGAATATINRVPVLILAGDTFAERVQGPVLQQVEAEHSPEQAATTLPEVMRILTSPADTGAVFLAVPQDIGTYAHDYPAELFYRRIW